MDFHEDFEAEIFDKSYLTKTKAQIIKLYKPLKIVSLIMFDRIILLRKVTKKFINLFNKIEVIKNFPVSLNLSLRIKQKTEFSGLCGVLS